MKILINTERFGTKEVLIDDADYHLIKDYSWHVQYDKGNFYSRCNVMVDGKYKSPKMHRMIMGVSDKQRPHIDHKNGNGLDNRRCNLRFATIAENSRNVGLTIRNTTGYKGVYRNNGSNSRPYVVRIKHNGVATLGGYFRTAIEAAEKYNELAKKYHGEFANINIINPEELHRAKQQRHPFKKYSTPISESGYYGVAVVKNRNKKYIVRMSGGILKSFYNPTEAAKYYDEIAISRYGQNAQLNFNR